MSSWTLSPSAAAGVAGPGSHARPVLDAGIYTLVLTFSEEEFTHRAISLALDELCSLKSLIIGSLVRVWCGSCGQSVLHRRKKSRCCSLIFILLLYIFAKLEQQKMFFQNFP